MAKKLNLFLNAFSLLLIFSLSLPLSAQEKQRELRTQRKYDIIVNQNNDTLHFNRGLRNLKANSEKLNDRGILTDLMAGYLSMGTSSLLSASQNLLGAGISYIKEAARDKRPDWENAVNGENRFYKKLPMVTEILDFYSEPSTTGALDPTNMKFSGFGCRQSITVVNEEGKPEEREVFYISCSVRDDDYGLSRILNHSKFEVVVDELRFDPYLCNLPNDTLSISDDTRHDFSFQTRNDLQFKVKARLLSSWINEAIQVNRDVHLGEFEIVAQIDSLDLDPDMVFRYKRENPQDKNKRVFVSGDSFIVPRSFVGSTDMVNNIPSWGTGQYRVEMDIEESCKLNREYYLSEDGSKWRKDRWMPEWKKMKRRPKMGPSQNFAQQIFPQFSNGQWITTIIEPATSVLISNESMQLNKAVQKLTAPTSSVSATPAMGGSSAGATPPVGK